ncbi:branched-chain amino acid ABC transporter permease [Komagataeibacter intermedius AF2]|uniref:Branched-chain amino acid ABC transporter permease n=2 Tax=Komagataeibacter intermedius TaxID=66229 RepID=A0A0N0MEV5_9PROT|nr:branched-chain amino acid ABC transporter permease [Komagataeibacter intermedius AF2]
MLMQQIVNGALLGAVYMLVALSFTIMIGVLNFLNFSLPGLFALGGMLTWICLHAGWGPVWAMVLAPAAVVAVALVTEWLVYWPSRLRDPTLPLVSSLAFLVLIENLLVAICGSDQQALPPVVTGLNIHVSGLVISGIQVGSLLLSIGVVIWLSWFLRATGMGRQIRCMAENTETALLLGFNIVRLVRMLFIISALLSAVAGILFACNYQQVSPFMGEEVGFKGLAAMIIGGVGSIWGAVLGGMLLGMVEVATISCAGAECVNIVVYGILLLLLVMRPAGLLGCAPQQEKL